MSSFNTSHFSIFDYWKDKEIDKSGNIYNSDDLNFKNTVPVVEDGNEPCCWACGMNAVTDDDMQDADEYYESTNFNDEKYLKYIYSRKNVKHNLQRAHITPRALGGEDKPDNLFLLCPRCHNDAPDVVDKRMFLSWVYQRRHDGNIYNRAFNKAKDILEDVYNLRPIGFNSEEFFDIKNRMNSHKGNFKESTYVYAIIQGALFHRTKLEGENDVMFTFAINKMINDLKNKGDEMSDTEKASLKTAETILKLYEHLKRVEMPDMNKGREQRNEE